MKPKKIHILLLIALAFGSKSSTRYVQAASLVVDSLADTVTTDGHCTLREAIQNTNNNVATNVDCAAGSGADTITFSVSGTITLGSGLPMINDTAGLTIDGSGQSVTISGNDKVHIITVVSLVPLTLNHLTIANGNTVGYGGGGIENYGSLTIIDSIFSNNNNPENHGGAIYNQSGTLNVTDSIFSGNNAKKRGGGIYALGGVVNISSSSFSGNTALEGGAIYGYDCNLTITNNGSFTDNNTTNGSGGGIYNIYGPLIIADSTFTTNGASWGSGGGGIYNEVGLLTITNSIFSGNSATGSHGGGIYNDATMNISKSTFSGNSAGTGGAIVNEGDNATIANSTFSANNASANGDNGGGIYNTGILIVTNNTLSGNSVPGSGGGIGNIGGTLTLRNTIVANNPGGNCRGTITNGGNNLDDGTTCGWGSASGSMSSTNPLLGDLTGTPAYFLLNSMSPAIDKGDDSICTAWPVSNQSQNGVARPQGAHCDIGSYEYDVHFYRNYLPLATQ